MEFRFTVNVPDGAESPTALTCSRLVSDHLWSELGVYEGVHMKHGRRVDPGKYEFIWEMGEAAVEGNPEELMGPTWMESCTQVNDPNAFDAEGADHADADADPDGNAGSDAGADADGAASGRSIIAAVGGTLAGPSDGDAPF